MILLIVIKLLKLGGIMSDKKFSFRKELEENSKKYNEVQSIQKQEIIDKRNEMLSQKSDLSSMELLNDENGKDIKNFGKEIEEIKNKTLNSFSNSASNISNSILGNNISQFSNLSQNGNGNLNRVKDKVLYTLKEMEIKINGEIQDVKDIAFTLKKEMLQHDLLDINFTIKDTELNKYNGFVHNLDDILEITLIRKTSDGIEDIKNIFCGTIEEIYPEKNSDEKGERYKCTIKTYSISYIMDKIKKYRVFQDLNMTYEDLLKEVTEEYSDKINVHIAKELAQPLKHIYIQYFETDMEFIRRILSDINMPVTSHVKDLLLGYVNSVEYEINIEENKYGRAREGKNLLMKVKGTDVYNAGEKLKVSFADNGREMTAEKIVLRSNIKNTGNEVFCEYDLIDGENSYKFKVQMNNNIAGQSIEGRVKEVSNEDGFAKMTVDFSEGIERYRDEENEIEVYEDKYKGLYKFSYQVPYSKSNTGLFCTPEIDDKIAVYFPNGNEGHGYIMGSVNNEGSGRFSDYENRNFHVNESDFNLVIAKSAYSVSAKDSISQVAESISEVANIIASNSENYTEMVSNNKVIVAKKISQTSTVSTSISSNGDTTVTSNGYSTISGGKNVMING